MGAEDAGFTAETTNELVSRLAAIVSSVDDAIVGKMLDGTITTWNAGATALYGYAPEEMIGRNISELIPLDRPGELKPILDRLARGERVDHFETRRLRNDGTVVDVSVSISPILNENGTVMGAASVARDISARIRAEADRQALQTRVVRAERLETVGQLAGGIAHDFNNLLGVIVGHSALLIHETASMPEIQADIQQIELAAQRAARLTRQLLIFSKRSTAKPQDMNLNEVIDDVRQLLLSGLGPGIELRFDMEGALPAITADRSHLEQVLLNLTVNARDAMPRGGTLTIGTAATELDQAYCRAHPGATPGHYVELAVSDTGTGMSPDVAARIFEPFFTTRAFGQGLGIGLSIAHGVVTQAGGSIDVQSEVGSGTVFRLYLPAAAVPAAVTPAAPDGPGPLDLKWILVADDEPAVLDIVSRVLTKNGYSVLRAHSGEEALSVGSAHDFDLLLTDSLMPQMSGPELVERFAEIKPGLRVLQMSGYSVGELNAELPRQSNGAILHKPFTPQTLLERVRAVLTAPPTR